jgi:Tol biopolymer transport system component
MIARTNLLKLSLVAAATILAISLLVLVAADKPAKAAFPGENGLIAFMSDRDSTIDADGNVLQLNDDIYVMNPNGSQPTCLTTDPAIDQLPAVSPNGKKVVFVSNRDGNQEIYVMNAANGSEQTNLTSNPASDSQPDFSPDGTQIAFRSNQDSIDPTTGSLINNSDIYAMDLTYDATSGAITGTSTPTNLTNTPAIPGQDNSGTNEQWPAWSPDGTKIAFWRGGLASGTDGGLSGHQSDFDSDIWVMDANCTPQSPLTNTATWGEVQPDWGPAPIKKK